MYVSIHSEPESNSIFKKKIKFYNIPFYIKRIIHIEKKRVVILNKKSYIYKKLIYNTIYIYIYISGTGDFIFIK